MPPIKADDVAQVQYTSGTTGTPKGARLTHRNLANNGRIYARTIGAGPQDIWINPMPMFHTAGCVRCTLGALQTGGARFCRRVAYKVPRIWRFVDQFPQTASGKIQKYVLRELYLAEMAS